MFPVIVFPVSLVSFLSGVGLATGRRGLTMLPRSPLPGVLLVRWVRFTTSMARHPGDYSSPRGQLGTFGMDMRRLADVGFAERPRKIVVGGETGVWDADFKTPITKKNFLGSPAAQYLAFRRSMTSMAPVVQEHVGAVVDGTPCTLSGLLGVGHQAGAAGVASWVRDPAVRAKFKKTTDTFNLVNGVF